MGNEANKKISQENKTSQTKLTKPTTNSYLCAPLRSCLPRRFAYILAFGVEFLAESGAKEDTNQRNSCKKVLHFHCTSSSILLDAVLSPHFPLFSESEWRRWLLDFKPSDWFYARNPDVSAL